MGKTYTMRELSVALRRLVPLLHRAGLVWILHGIEPGFREEIMVTVARANHCRYCTYVHQEWAIRAGTPNCEIAELEGVDPATFDRARWSGLVYARSLAESDLGGVPAEISWDAARYYSPAQQRNIEAVAMVMTIVNRCANTLDAFWSRLRGAPMSQSLPAEVAITSTLMLTAPILVPLLALVLRRSPRRLLRELSVMAPLVDQPSVNTGPADGGSASSAGNTNTRANRRT